MLRELKSSRALVGKGAGDAVAPAFLPTPGPTVDYRGPSPHLS